MEPPLTCKELLNLISEQFRKDGGTFSVTPKDVAKQVFEDFADKETAEYTKAFFREKEGAPRVMVISKRTDPSRIFLETLTKSAQPGRAASAGAS